MARIVCALSTVALCASVPAWGQAVNATLLGTVTDSSGAVVASAKVTITESSTNSSRTSDTNESGNYTFPDITPGTYSVTAEAAGFKRAVRQNIDVVVNTSTRVDVQLQPGNITESIEVTDAPPPLQTDRADTGRKIETVQTENLPVGTNRNFQNLLNLVPGTTRASFQHSQFFNASSSLQTEVNGQMRMGNNYQIEGIDDNERTGLLQILVPPIEAIQTVDVSTSNFDAELGRATGAVTNVILKSGSNTLHGGAYEFLQNSYLNARNFFDPSVGARTYNYFGGNLGGPIKKNKLFYFGDYLRTTDHQANTNRLTIPTPIQRSGNLGASNTVIYDPSTGNPDGTGRTPFAGNIIPASRINPISAKILNLIPDPNVASSSGSNNWFGLLPFHKDTDQFDTKIDWVISDKDRLTGRFSFQRPVIFQGPAFGPAGGAVQGAFEGTGVQKTYSGGLNYTRVFTSTLVSEFRVGVAHYNNVAQQSDFGTKASEALGIPGINIDALSSGLLSINIGSFYSNPLVGYSASLPWYRAEANIDVVNSWTKILGNHTIKFGGDLRRVRDDLLQLQTINPRGQYTFGPGQTALRQGNGSATPTSYYNNFAGFLLDLPSTVGRDLGGYYPAYRQWEFFGFVNDKWQASQKLTLDLGVRWEFYPPATPRFAGGFSNYDPVKNQLVIAGIGGNPSNLGMDTRYKNFAPRIGVAYRLTDKTVIRTGFGISYTPFPDNNYAFNYPIRQNNVYNPAVASYGPALLPDGQVASFQKGLPAPVLAPIPSDGIITNPDPHTAYFTVNPHFRNPYVESWNFAIQQALPQHFTLDVAYVANHGVDSVVQYNLNATTRGTNLGNAGLPEIGFGRTAATTLLFAGYSNSYNGLQVKLDRRFSGGLSITTAYTYAKGLGFQGGDDGGLAQNFYIDPRRSYARNDFDRTHTFVQSYVYDLPFGPGKRFLSSGLLSNILGGWRVNGILTLMTGTPFTIGASGTSLNTPGNNQTADQVKDVAILHGINVGNPWFDPTAFVQPTAPGVFGNSGRNLMTGPGFFNLDGSLFKVISVRERYKLELRGEAFGLTNTPQFSNPGTAVNNYNADPSKNTFGVITGAGGGRSLQLGARLTF
ncbi:MAG TPA: carboxypeptidase regulatory-like domain-containing protein [Bryobacteraceae bacterium]|nr:carboxypeptidase regulatory-like domain-containing protein [Bryobacteraceae bacterium]